MYRDASNYKRDGDVALAGAITEEQREAITGSLQEGVYFIPEQLGWSHLGYGFPSFPAYEDDHCFHEIIEFEVVETDEITVMTVDEAVSAFTTIGPAGWDVHKYAVES